MRWLRFADEYDEHKAEPIPRLSPPPLPANERHSLVLCRTLAGAGCPRPMPNFSAAAMPTEPAGKDRNRFCSQTTDLLLSGE